MRVAKLQRIEAEEEIQRNYQIQIALNALLHISLLDISLEDQLKLILDHILSIPWLAFESRGSIFLVEDDPEVLVMKAQNGIADPIQKTCARVPFGRCHCGRAALTREIQFADCLDDRHETRYEGITPHGHYCVPIVYAGRTLGVVNLYLREGHHRDQREEEFLTAVVNTLAGIIQRKKAEEEKEKIQAQLLQAQKMEAIGTLTGGVAHDFNNLLTAIQGYTELAMREVDEADPLYMDLKQVLRAAGRAAGLTRQLLLFSRKQPMELTPLNINQTVDSLLKMLNRLIGEDIAIKTDLEPDLWTVRANEGKIEQVIMNLAGNARDAMPEGGELIIKTENVTLDEDYCKVIPESRPGKFVYLSVADTGVGMDKEILQRIFEPFFSTKEVGTGLGLSVVYGIVKEHEGWINVYSEPGQGSTFKVYLPAFYVEPEDETEETVSLQELRGRGERILLVEDEEGVREFVRRALSENGYVVFEATSAEEALDIFERAKGRFRLVFSDVVLPDESGLQLVDQLLFRKPELRVLLSSGYADQKSQWPVICERGFRFLQKPYALPDLLRAIREAVEQAK